MPDWKQIQIKDSKSWVTFVLNRPHVHNALNQSLLAELKMALEWLRQQKQVRVLVMTGAGDKAFSAGADITEFARFSSNQDAKEWVNQVHQLFLTIETLPIPVIMAVNGYALGGGCELALTGDICLAAEQAVFGQPEVDLGLIPGYGGTQRLARVVGKSTAKYLCMTGEKISAQEANRLGIVQKVIRASELDAEVEKLAKQLTMKPPIAIQSMKRSINQGAELKLHEGLQVESANFAYCFASKDSQEGIQAFLEKRNPDFKGE